MWLCCLVIAFECLCHGAAHLPWSDLKERPFIKIREHFSFFLGKIKNKKKNLKVGGGGGGKSPIKIKKFTKKFFCN